MNKKNKKINRGFSLIEIMILLSVMAIILVIEAPNLKNYSDSLLLKSTTQNLIADLRQAQQRTVTEQQIYSIALNTGLNSYSLIREPSTVVQTKNLPSGTSFGLITGFTGNKISFNFVGAVAESGSITINNNTSKIIDIRPSGYIAIR